jgi:hypothetical protein
MAVAGALWLWGCGDSTEAEVTDSQTAAVDAASSNFCDHVEACHGIGEGKTYASRNDCQTNRTAFWNEKWPQAACEDRIHEDNLQRCLDALERMDCNSLVDELRVLNGDCAQSKVCGEE